MSTGPVYVVINHARTFDVPSTLLHGIYPTIDDIPPVEDNETLLPIIVQCFSGDVPDLQPLQSLIEDVRLGDIPEDEVEQKSFVQGVIKDMASTISPIFPHNNKFYGILGTSTTTKMVAMDWTPTPGVVYHVFSDFMSAFIYVLSGGNKNLGNWGLDDWMGYEIEPFRSETSFPLARLGAGLFSSSFAGGLFSVATGSKKDVGDGNNSGTPPKRMDKGKGKEVDGDGDVADQIPGALALNEAFTFPGVQVREPDERLVKAVAELRKRALQVKREESATPIPEFVEGRAASTPSEPVSPLQKVDDNKTLPEFIVPPGSLTQLQAADNNVPFMALRDPHQHGFTLANDDDVEVRNGPLPLNHGELPPLVIFYLRTHGWPERVIDVVSIAHSCEASLHGFLKTMACEGMALAEASFVWHTLRFL